MGRLWLGLAHHQANQGKSIRNVHFVVVLVSKCKAVTLCVQLGCIDFIAMTTAFAAVAGIGPMKELHPTRPDPQICVPSKLGVMALGYLYGFLTQCAVVAVLVTQAWFQGSNKSPDYVSCTLTLERPQACRLHRTCLMCKCWDDEVRLARCLHHHLNLSCSCCVMLCCAVLCCAVLCCAVLCCAVLPHIILCYQTL